MVTAPPSFAMRVTVFNLICCPAFGPVTGLKQGSDTRGPTARELGLKDLSREFRLNCVISFIYI